MAHPRPMAFLNPMPFLMAAGADLLFHAALPRLVFRNRMIQPPLVCGPHHPAALVPISDAT